ncbi:MAG: single-stranded DNA-binding protein [Candidatus Curtissbacteria bacterium]|nr:single-stranded DNA-binding protein [Candidatus Curtissbacteria bacterium]
MGSRASLNKVLLIGNLTRDPELRYTPSGAAVCSFGLATNRTYVASDGTKKEEAEFIKIVSWNKLAELCSQLLTKGRKVYVEGRLQTRSWETPDGQNRQTTEVVIDDMRILDSRKEAYGEEYVPRTSDDDTKGVKSEKSSPRDSGFTQKVHPEGQAKPAVKAAEKEEAPVVDSAKEDIDLEDLPF